MEIVAERNGSASYVFIEGSSRNLAGFALRGLNGEVGVCPQGDTHDPAFIELRKHVNIARAIAAQ